MRSARRAGGSPRWARPWGWWCWRFGIRLVAATSVSGWFPSIHEPGRRHTLSWPCHLLLRVDLRHSRRYLEPHRAAAVPGFHVCSGRYLGEVVLRWARVVDLLGADVVDGSAGGDGRYAGGVGRLVAADIGRGSARDALFGVCVFGAAGGRPVCGVGLSVDDETWEGVWWGLVKRCWEGDGGGQWAWTTEAAEARRRPVRNFML